MGEEYNNPSRCKEIRGWGDNIIIPVDVRRSGDGGII